VTIDQMDFNCSSSMVNQGSIVPWIENSQLETESIGVGMYPSLMGTFNFPSPVSYICATLVDYQKSSSPTPVTRVVSFKASYLQDPWVLPSPSDSVEGHTHVGMAMPLSAAEVLIKLYNKLLQTSDQTPSLMEEDDLFPEPIWAQNSSNSQDCLDTIFPLDEAIIEAMTGDERPWEDMHHRSYFLPMRLVMWKMENSSQP
jgi:hypothetical protein